MLATFVIGLREGIEAALIVGIIAAFLRRNGQMSAVRSVMGGVALAVAICLAIAGGLQVLAANMEGGQQQALEIVIGVAAVGMVSYMVRWMCRNSRRMKGHLEGAAAIALAQGTASALVMMAFLAVLREGIETSVFLLAAFTSSQSPVAAGAGALIGILAAVAIGYGIYRGGIRFNIARFFRITGVVLVLVAAGLVISSVHAAQEISLLPGGDQVVLSFGVLADEGSLLAAMLTGVLGIRSEVTLLELAGWLAYAIPMLALVLWPTPRGRVPAGAAPSVSAAPQARMGAITGPVRAAAGP